MAFRWRYTNVAFSVLIASSPVLAAEPSAEGRASVCSVHVWQSKHFESANGNAVGGLVGALVEGAVNASAPPKLVSEQMGHNLEDQNLAGLVEGADWSRYVGTRPVRVSVEKAVDDKTMRTMERSRTRSSVPSSDCQIDLFVEKQIFQGGMKTWLFSNFGIQVFDGGQYRDHRGNEYTHVQNFPAKSADQYPAAIAAIKDGFSRNLAKFLESSFARADQ